MLLANHLFTVIRNQTKAFKEPIICWRKKMGRKRNISGEAFVIHGIYPGLSITEFPNQKESQR